jgi:hypothetical protein
MIDVDLCCKKRERERLSPTHRSFIEIGNIQ